MAEELHALAERAAKAAGEWSPGCAITELRPLPGGRSSRTYAARMVGGPREHERIVMKVAPAGLPPVRNRDVLRQARLLRALSDAPGIRVPRVLFEDSGEPPDVPPMFAMAFVEGSSFEPHLDKTDDLPPPVEIEARARSAARMLAALHRVPAAGVGLGDEPEVELAEEIERWVRAFSTVDEGLRPGADLCAEALRAARPRGVPSTLVHGDYRLGNMLCRGPEILAVIDWEIWSRGDPRVDLAWFLLVANPDHPSAVRDAPGMLRGPELLREYEEAGGAPASDPRWFEAHALFKVAAVSALLVKHHRGRGEGQEFVDRMTKHIPLMLDGARALLE